MQYRRDRFRHWLARKILGAHSEDFEWGCDACRYKREHQLFESGPKVIDMNPILAQLGEEYNATLVRMLEYGERDPQARILWIEEDPD